VIIDAHQHFWRLDRGDYGWLRPNLGELYRDYLPHELAPLLDLNGVTATVVVQAAPSEAETHYLLELARAEPFIAGVVGWVDFEADDAAQRITTLAASSAGRLKGLRPMLQDIADPDWVLLARLDSVFAALAAQDLTLDALVMPCHLTALLRRLHRNPELRVVIDHGGKPDIAGNQYSPWAEDIARLARETSACCKLSGLLNEAGSQVETDVVDPYARHILECFGHQRVMWGSDWPVLNAVSDYGRWLDLARALVQLHAPGHEREIFAANAVAFYKLDPVQSSVQSI
jgi:L-fuconolactonase